MDTTRKKVMSVAIVVALLSVAVIGVMNMPVQAKNNEINIIAQVNQNGSAIIMKGKDIPEGTYCDISETGEITFTPDQKNMWRKKVIGTPGDATIQHTMLESFVNEKLELNFRQYEKGMTLSEDTVYYYTGIQDKDKFDNTPELNGCIIWEYMASKITVGTDRTGTSIIDSKYMEPNHACCVIGAKDSYLGSNYNSTVRFLQAYIKSVEKMNELIAAGSGTEYDEFINWAIEYAELKDVPDNKSIITNALNNVKYTYGLETGDVLSLLKTNIENFVNNNPNKLNEAVLKQGYSSVKEFTNQLVNDTYLKDALEEKTLSGSMTTIKIATIRGDVHQIALQWGIEVGFFKNQNISIECVPCANGTAVATNLQNGGADMGLMGVPPITSTVINSKLDPAIHFELTGTITDSDGEPVRNADVKFIPSCNQEYTARTDDTGSFKINVIKGTYAFENNSISVKGSSDPDYKVCKCNPIDRITSNIYIKSIVVS